MKPAIRFLSICAALFGILLAPATVAGADSDAEEILRGFVEDFANDPFASDLVFGFSINEERWHMRVEKSDDGLTSTSLHEGFLI